MLLFKLVSAAVIATSSTPVAAPVVNQVSREKWVFAGTISSIYPEKINQAINKIWPGLTINDFRWIEGVWFQNGNDKAYEWNKPKRLHTMFYERRGLY